MGMAETLGVKPEDQGAGPEDKLEQKDDPPAAVVAATAAASSTALKEADVDEHIGKLFARYDLDSGGTLNTKDELEQLCYNLAFKLKLENSTKDMDAYLNQVPEL